MLKKLAIVTTHPIQYYAPVFKLLAKECELKVFYTWGENSMQEKLDPQFNQVFKWDIPLLEGYTYHFTENRAKNKGSHHFKGIINPHLIEEINSFKPDAILVYGWAYHSHLKVLRHFKNKNPVWFRGDSTLLDDKPDFKAILRKLFLKWVYQNIDAAFYVGDANKAYYKKIGLKEQQLIFAPHSIDNERFSQNHALEAQKLRANLGIADHEILVLFAGKFEPKKDPLRLLKNFLAVNINATHLLFVGNGILAEDLKQMAKGYNHIHFMDFQNQSQMPIIYHAADLFCLPSAGPGETWGLATNEAMAAKKAVLLSNKVGCTANLVKAKFNGDVFKAQDDTDLQQKLISLLNSKEILFEMGKKSFQIIQNFSFEQQATKIIQTLYR